MKYIRTHHLPYSPSISNDDKVLDDISCFIDKYVVYTEKLDGENTSMSKAGIHARSETSSFHPSQSWVRKLYGEICWRIPNNLQIVGENMYAKHSIYYDKLDTFFYVFAVIENEKTFLSYDDTADICDSLGLSHVPVLKIGKFDPDFKLPSKSRFGDTIEGYVIRSIDSFNANDANSNIAKWVRPNHVQSDKHWKENWIPNKLF
jgi:hypothetical protein